MPVKSSRFDDGLVNVSRQLLCQKSESAAAAHGRLSRDSGGLLRGGAGAGLLSGGELEVQGSDGRAAGPRGTLDSVAIHVHSRLA